MMRKILDCLWLSILAAALAVSITAIAGCLSTLANGQEAEHVHPNETIHGAAGKFYESWMRPDLPMSSCCDKKDCYATRVRFVDGKIQAVHRESGEWIDIPPEKIEHNRDSPDGQSHLCAGAYMRTVYCFILGGGT